MRVQRFGLLAVSGLSVAFAANTLQAVIITNDDGSGAVTVFDSAGYENGDVAGDPPVHTATGNWKHARDGGYANDGGLMITESNTSLPSPGAYKGTHYGHNKRGSAGEDAFSRAQFSGGAITSGTIKAEWMMYVPNASLEVNAIAFWSDSGGNPLGGIRTDASGGGVLRVLGFDGGGGITGWNNTSIPVTFGAWQHYVMEWTIGLPVMTVSVDGVSQDITAPAFPNALTWLQFSPASAGAEFYLDDLVTLPEPASMLLLALGGLVLRRRR